MLHVWLRVLLIGAMAVGSVAVWVVNPMLWLWITARLQRVQPSMGPYVLMLVGITVTSVVLGKGLATLNRAYGNVTGTSPTLRVVAPWRRSLRGGRSLKRETDGRLPVSVLDVVMVVSVAIAVVALVLWFFVVQPAPPGIGPGLEGLTAGRSAREARSAAPAGAPRRHAQPAAAEGRAHGRTAVTAGAHTEARHSARVRTRAPGEPGPRTRTVPRRRAGCPSSAAP